jgi:hypothetical protein
VKSQVINDTIEALVKGGILPERDRTRAIDCLDKTFANRMMIVWTDSDVLEVCPGLTDEEAREVLDYAERKHDASLGVTWETFKAIAEIDYGDRAFEDEDDEQE